MKNRFLPLFMIAILLLCFLLAGCSVKTQDPSTESPLKEGAGDDTLACPPSVDAALPFEPEISEEIDFRYIYRGFTAVALRDSEKIKQFQAFDAQPITTEEEWAAFMAAFCPGIPYEEPWDFSKDYLIASITKGASPVYTNSNTITKLRREDGHFLPEYENDPNHYIYAINSPEYTHFYVEVIAVSKEPQSPVQKKMEQKPVKGVNCTPFARQVWYNTCTNCTKKWGVFLCLKEYPINAIHRSLRSSL